MTTPILTQIVRFASVGVIATAIQYILLALFVEKLSIEPVTASAAAFTLSAFVNYYLNRRFTFSSSAGHAVALPKFFAVAFVGLGLNTVVMLIAYSLFGAHYLLAQVLATGVVFLWTFTGNRLWTFR